VLSRIQHNASLSAQGFTEIDGINASNYGHQLGHYTGCTVMQCELRPKSRRRSSTAVQRRSEPMSARRVLAERRGSNVPLNKFEQECQRILTVRSLPEYSTVLFYAIFSRGGSSTS